MSTIKNTTRGDFFKKDFFKNINLSDPFFNTLKADYAEFEDWYNRKGDNEAFYYEDEDGIQAFLYLKCEEEALTDIYPELPQKKRIKIGTLKINAHGTKFGDRFIKKAIDYALLNNTNQLYVTVFNKHQGLIALLKKYGFAKHGTKTTTNGIEEVLIKDINPNSYSENNLPSENYPLISKKANSWILAIYPEWHSRLFPDSILYTERTEDVVADVSYSNSIEKVYICRMSDVQKIKEYDQLVIYRTKESGKKAEYSALASSICTVVEVKSKEDFNNVDEVIDYCLPYSIFTEEEIRQQYQYKNMFVIKMLYSYSLPKRVIRKYLIEECGIDRNSYWGIINLTEHQFGKILELGDAHEGIIVD